MHIAVVTRNMKAGGAERVIAQLLSKWNHWGVTCSLISIDPADPFYRVPDGVECYDIACSCDVPGISKLLKYAKLRKLLKKLQPDVVLSMPEEIGIYVILAMLGTGIHVVVSERNNPWVMPYKKATRFLRRLAYPFAKGLIFQTEQAAAFFPKNQREKGIVLDNPLDLSRLPESFRGDREKTVVSAGRLEDQKNFPLLIKAFSGFHRHYPEYRLVIYGEGKKRQELESLAEGLLPEGAWSMPGQTNTLLKQISACSFFALSSDYEGVPNVLIEAMACGMPVVSTDCAPGGAATLIENGVNGLLVAVGDQEALTNGLVFLAEHPEEARKMGEKAAEIRKRMDAEAVCASWLKYLEKTIV